MLENIILNELRRLILLKTGIKIISPSDCKYISSLIQKELNKTVSETTVKRFFGFAEIKNQFSRYTINTFREFVDEQYIENDFAPVAIFPNYENNLASINQKAKSITKNTIKHIKNRSSLPYEMTIGRRFAKYDFDYFYISRHSFTSFISQPGYGKSTLLSHLVNDLFLEKNALYQQDVILFLNAAEIFDTPYDAISIEDSIKIKLAINENTDLIEYFNEQYQNNQIKLIFIIDGFSELLANKFSKPKVFEKIVNFLTEIDQSQSIKLVLSMRTTTWHRFYEMIRSADFLNKMWFRGSYFSLNENANVPALTFEEVEEIFHKINPLEHIQLSDNLKSQLKFPYHIQWYYQLKERYPNFDSYTNITFYQIVDHIIQQKIYQSNYATEKTLYCKKIIQLTDFGKIGNSVLKADLLKDLFVFKNAYMELLAEGILMEEKVYKDGINLEFVRFVQPYVFEYFLFLELLDQNEYVLDLNFFKQLNTTYYGNHVRFQLLQWAIRFAIRTHKFDCIKHLLDLNLSNFEKNYLIFFIGEKLNYIIGDNPAVKKKIGEKNVHKILLRHLIHFDFIDSSYKDAINTLLLIVDDDNEAIYYQSILAIIDCLSLDQELILARIDQLEKLNYLRSEWLIDPYDALKIIHSKSIGITTIQNDALQKIEDFKNNPHLVIKVNREFPNINEILSFLLMLTINLFHGSPKQAVKIISSIKKLYPKLFSLKKPFAFYLLNVAAVARAKTNPDTKTDQMQRIITNFIEKKYKNSITLYQHSLFQSLKALQYKNKNQYDKALKIIFEYIETYNRNNLMIYKIIAYDLIINIYQKMGDIESASKYITLKINALEKTKTNPTIFHSVN